MSIKNTHIYTIRCLTNTHPGSGDTNFGLVDKMVQRDPITGAPTIHASSLKGAIREYFANQLDDGHSDENLCELFGTPPKTEQKKLGETQSGKGKNKGLQQGDLRFMSADLLLFPVMSTKTTGSPYTLRYDDSLYGAWREKMNLLSAKETIAEDWIKEAYPSVKPLGQKGFKEAYTDLPVIARNYLENGISDNLWYEELVPRETIFAFAVYGSSDALKKLKKGWGEVKGINSNIIQIGANATVGCGYCHFTRIGLKN